MKLGSYSAIDLLQKRKRLCRELRSSAGLRSIRIAVLGGTTTNELVDLLELVLLAGRFDPVFYQSDYNRFFEDAVLEPEKLKAFRTGSGLRSHPLQEHPESSKNLRLRDSVSGIARSGTGPFSSNLVFSSRCCRLPSHSEQL